MKFNKAFCSAVFAAVALLPAYSQTSAPAAVVPASYPPSAAEVVKLARSGVGDDVVTTYIQGSPTVYNLSADDIVALRNAGISSPVITAMLNHDQALRVQPAPAPSSVTPPGSYEQKLYAPTAASAAIPNAPSIPAAPTVPAAPVAAPATPAPVVQVAPPQPVVPSTTIVEQTPPPPQVEVVPLAPGPDYYWVPGYWTWRGTWVWVGGRYAYRPWHGAVWVGGSWGRHGRGYIWVGGHWR